MGQVGAVVDAVLLGQESDCDCSGTSQAARLETTTSKPAQNGFGWARYCPRCKKQTPLTMDELQTAKDDYRRMFPVAVANGWLPAGL